MGPNANVSVHFLREFEAVTLGGFLGYSMADHENSDSERYETFYQGVEAHFDIGSSAIGYVQVGLGDEKSVDQSSGGFVNGKFGRIGLIHQTAQGAALGLEFELARAEDYEDEDENAYFRSLALSYEQELNANFNWIAELRHSYVSVPEDGDALKETSIYLGLRKTFGDKTPGALQRAGFIGDPYLIKRNGVYVPATD